MLVHLLGAFYYKLRLQIAVLLGSSVNIRLCQSNCIHHWLGVVLCKRRVYQKSNKAGWKPNKLIAQGSALGKSIPNNNAPCKGKSVNYQCFCPCRAFCFYQSVHPRRCLGLWAYWAFSPYNRLLHTLLSKQRYKSLIIKMIWLTAQAMARTP